MWRFLVNFRLFRSPEYKEMKAALQKAKEDRRAEIIAEKQRRPYERQQKEEERKKAQQERLEALQKQKEWNALAKRMREDGKKPVAAVLISTQDRYGRGLIGTAARTALGGALFGVFGAAVGLSTARSELVAQKATFSVRYKNGSTGTETVDVGSKRFKELAALLVK